MFPAGHRAQGEPNREPASWLRITALTTEDGPWAGLCHGPQVSWPRAGEKQARHQPPRLTPVGHRDLHCTAVETEAERQDLLRVTLQEAQGVGLGREDPCDWQLHLTALEASGSLPGRRERLSFSPRPTVSSLTFCWNRPSWFQSALDLLAIG